LEREHPLKEQGASGLSASIAFPPTERALQKYVIIEFGVKIQEIQFVSS